MGTLRDLLRLGLLRLAAVRMNGAELDGIYPGTLGTYLGLLTDPSEHPDHGLSPALGRVAEIAAVRLHVHVTALHLHATGVEMQWQTSSSSYGAHTTHTQHVDDVDSLMTNAEARLSDALGRPLPNRCHGSDGQSRLLYSHCSCFLVEVCARRGYQQVLVVVASIEIIRHQGEEVGCPLY